MEEKHEHEHKTGRKKNIIRRLEINTILF